MINFLGLVQPGAIDSDGTHPTQVAKVLQRYRAPNCEREVEQTLLQGGGVSTFVHKPGGSLLFGRG